MSAAELGSLEVLTSRATAEVRDVLEQALGGRELGRREVLVLGQARGAALEALGAVADALRREQVGDEVGYVVNRNVNFTNVCVKACRFCAFSRTSRSEEAYFLSEEEVVRRAVEAAELGATEVCLQAGLAPGLDPWTYVRLTRAVKRAAPALHVHGFSPEEVKYAARLARVGLEHYLEALQEAGLGSLPGTSAEVLVPSVRELISPGRITVQEWCAVIRAAHRLGIPTTCTLMFGHVETLEQRVEHLLLLRSLQRETHGFTEFVPLAFVHEEAPLFARQLVPGLRAGPSAEEVTALYALSRLLLGRDIPHLQVSWVKHGPEEAQRLLGVGADDLGGTLMNESISTSAGAQHGQLLTPRQLRRLIRAAGRRPVQRSTTYEVLRRFEQASDGEHEALDTVTDADSRFGSYQQLVSTKGHRFVLERRAPRPAEEP